MTGFKSHGLLDQVDNIIKHAKLVPVKLNDGSGDFIQAQLVRHGCLLVCAAIEQALLDAASLYAKKHGDERLRGFVEEALKTGKNPSPSYINEVLCRFDSGWGTVIADFIDNNVGIEIIKSIVSNRNRIAHGLSVSMGVRSLDEWTPPARALCQEILDLVDKSHRSQAVKVKRTRKKKNS